MLARRFILSRPVNVAVRSFSSDVGPRFELSDAQKEYQKLARDFARTVMIPQAAKYDQTMEYPQEIFKQAWELGLVNSHVPESCGGLGLHTM